MTGEQGLGQGNSWGNLESAGIPDGADKFRQVLRWLTSNGTKGEMMSRVLLKENHLDLYNKADVIKPHFSLTSWLPVTLWQQAILLTIGETRRLEEILGNSLSLPISVTPGKVLHPVVTMGFCFHFFPHFWINLSIPLEIQAPDTGSTSSEMSSDLVGPFSELQRHQHWQAARTSGPQLSRATPPKV